MLSLRCVKFLECFDCVLSVFRVPMQLLRCFRFSEEFESCYAFAKVFRLFLCSC